MVSSMKRTIDPASLTLPYQECSLEDPGRCHFCRIHQDEASLTSAAIRYLQLGAVSDESLVMVTNTVRRRKILDWLMAAGVDVPKLQKKQRMFIYTSQDLVETLFEDGMPDWEIFADTVTEMIDTAGWHGEKKVRFYGDAVSDLWASGNHAGAVALEEYWARLALEKHFNAAFFCGYVIDAFSIRSYNKQLIQLGRPHSFVMPSRESTALSSALDRAGREVLGINVSTAAARDNSPEEPWQRRLPRVFQSAMWLGKTHPAAMPRVLERARAVYAA